MNKWLWVLVFWSGLAFSASLPKQAHPADRAVPARRQQRYRRADARHAARRSARPVGGDREQGRAGGVLGTDSVAKATPDGYSLLLISVAYAFAPALYKTLPYDPATAFAPITIVGRGPSALTVHPSVPANTVAELIALAKKSPGKLNYASAGVGSFQHLSAALFNEVPGRHRRRPRSLQGRRAGDGRRDGRPGADRPCLR